MKVGYFLSCEEYGPDELVEQAVLAEKAGFTRLWISDHYHPWNDEQGQSPFVWSVIGAISQVCSLPVTTAVTCPTVRMHPAVVAQAAATSAVMLGGRFVLGVGSGEALNEHVLGHAVAARRAAAGDVGGGRRGDAGPVDRRGGLARGPALHRRHGTDLHAPGAAPAGLRLGLRARRRWRWPRGSVTGSSPRSRTVMRWLSSDGSRATTGRRRWLGSRWRMPRRPRRGRDHAHRLWANAGLPGELAQVLPSPQHFEQAATLVTKESTGESVVCGSDAEEHRAAFEPYEEAGFDEVYVANMGPRWREMIAFYGDEVLPQLS